jgi:hypothetical protein
MTHYFRTAIELATGNQSKIFWATLGENSKSEAMGFFYKDFKLFEIRVNRNNIVLTQYISEGMRTRIAGVTRTSDKIGDLKNLLRII